MPVIRSTERMLTPSIKAAMTWICWSREIDFYGKPNQGQELGRPRPPFPQGGNQARRRDVRGSGETAQSPRAHRKRRFDCEQAGPWHLLGHVFLSRFGCNWCGGGQTGGHLVVLR